MQDEREQREHEAWHTAWLNSPEGIASQEAERAKQRKQIEEEQQRRREAAESAARTRWKLFYESATMEEISRMSGRGFEEFLARLFAGMGYTELSLTPTTNDQGGDVLCRSPSGAGVVIQAKRWKGNVGNAAVMELLGAMLHYGRAQGMVVTNSRFTDPARELAKKDSRITLCDGRWLNEQIARFLPAQVPEFTWKEFNGVVKNRCLPGMPLYPRETRSWIEEEFVAAEVREAAERGCSANARRLNISNRRRNAGSVARKPPSRSGKGRKQSGAR